MIELRHIIDSKREVLRRETFSRTPVNYSEGMVEDQKDRFIQYLAEQYQEEQLIRKAVELVLEDFMERQKSLEEQLALLRAQHRIRRPCVGLFKPGIRNWSMS